MGDFYRLKTGSHAVGSGDSARFMRADNPQANVTESEEDLAAQEPSRWEMVRNPTPEQKSQATGTKRNIPTEPRPPSPASPQQRAAAEDLRASSAEEKRQLAEELRARADALEEAADDSEKASKDSEKMTKEATKHKMEALSQSDSLEQQQKEFEEVQKRAEEQADKQEKAQAAAAKKSQSGQSGQSSPRASQAAARPQTATRSQPDFDSMTVEQLKEHAEENEIDLKGATLKDDILKTVKGASKSK